MVRIRGQLIADIVDAAARRPIPYRVIDEALRIQEERMARTGESVQLVIAKRLRSPSVGQTRPIADWVVDIVHLVDLAAGGRELMLG